MQLNCKEGIKSWNTNKEQVNGIEKLQTDDYDSEIETETVTEIPVKIISESR